MSATLLADLRRPDLAASSAAARLAGLVVTALIDEVTLAPKPGLVDVRGQGAHHDLDWALMCRSARALRPAFEAMALAGATLAETLPLRERIGRLGRDGEAAMLRATSGINTHRGAIWALGLLITAAAQAPADCTPQQVALRAALLANTPDRHTPRHTGHKGERARRDYGVGGARGQAEAGFPHVIEVALPALWQARAAGAVEDAARLDALLALMSLLDDTCVLARGGPAALDAVQAGAARVLDAGGCATPAGRRELARLEAELLALHVSPGGSADLLAATLFLDRLNHPAPAPDGRH